MQADNPSLDSHPSPQANASPRNKGKSKLSPEDEEIEKERQAHLTTIDLLDRVANGDTSAGGLLPTELLEDPLDAHLLYVRWTLDTYGTQEENLKKHLIILLEQSTRRFVNEDRYRSDLRYLKLWVLYARQCSKRGAVKIYEYLHSKEIGVEFSMFYEEWANSIEQHPEHIKTIEEIFDLGIKREAQPFNRLKKRKVAVLQRVSQSTSEKDLHSSLPSSNELCDDPLRNHLPTISPNNPSAEPDQNSNRNASVKEVRAPPTQRLALDLLKLYPEDGTEISPEEYKAWRQYPSHRWGIEPWEVEAFTTANWYYFNLDGSPILYDPVSREPLFAYLKESPASSAMHLSEDEVVAHDFLDSKSDSSGVMPQDADQSMATSEHMANLSLSNLTSSTDNDDFESGSAPEAVADTEISIKLDSPARDTSTAYVKPRNRRASVTMNTQEALNDVYNMYGKPAKGSDESDDNFDNSEPGDEDRLYDENTAFTVTGIRDATADVTFWSQLPKNSNSNEENNFDHQNPSEIQDENALVYCQPRAGPSEPTSCNQSRGLGAFKPVRKPLANVAPFSHPDDASITPFSGAQSMYSGPGPSGTKRMPLAVKATHPPQPLIDQDNLQDLEVEPDPRVTRTNTFDWQSQSPSNRIGTEYHTPEILNDAPHFSSQEEDQFDVNMNYEGAYVGESDYEDENYLDGGGRLISRPLRFVPIGDNFNALTPITERTSEYSSMTAPRYINRVPVQEAQFSLHHPRTGKFPIMEFDDDSQSELTPKPNHFNGENSEEMNSFDHNKLYEQQVSGSMPVEACGPRPSLNGLDHHRMYHSVDTPSKLHAHLHQSGDTSLSEDNVEDSLMASPSRFSSNRHIPVSSPTPIQACEPCNPFATHVVNIILDGLDPPLDTYPGFQSFMNQTANKLQQMTRQCKARNRKHSQSSATADELLWEIDLGGDQYIIYEKLGEGAYGSVFRVSEAVKEDCTAIYEDNSIQKAMKVESPPNLYEFSILSHLHQTLSQRLCESIIKPHKLYAYADESFLLMDYSDQGTLLDIVNRAADIGIKPTAPGITRGVDELVAMFFTIELMRVVEGLHETGYIHGDLKIDNCMVRLQSLPGGGKSWSSTYDPDGNDGWSYKGLKLIDYGRSIDTGVFPPSQEFVAEWQTDEYDCVEMRTGRPWTYQPDYHGILGIAHCLLFGFFMTEKDSIKPGFKRYHQTELWNNLFEVCLSPREIPNIVDLKSVRISMENWLKENCERNGKSLKGFLKKIELASLSAYH